MMPKPAAFLSATALVLSACAAPATLTAPPRAETRASTGLRTPDAAAFYSGGALAARMLANPFRFRAPEAVPRCTEATAMPTVFPPDSLGARGTMQVFYPLGGPTPAPLPNVCGGSTVRIGRR